MTKQTIKKRVEMMLDMNMSLCYGEADSFTNSQSGARDMRKLLNEAPEKYEMYKKKSVHGGTYIKYAIKGSMRLRKAADSLWHIFDGRNYQLSAEGFKTRKEAKAQIKEVKRRK